MASLVPTIKDKEFQNWLRGAMALFFTKKGLDGFVLDEITQFQNDMMALIFTKNNISVGTVCNTCTTENVLLCPTQNFCSKGRKCSLHNPALPDKNPDQICPNNICQDIREAIRREHRYNSPSWKNTDASKWCTNALEIAKCYMAPEGYSAVSTFADTDFNGLLAVIINNKRFQNKMAAHLHQQINICTESRDVGRVVRHSAELSITDTDLTKYIDTLINLLSDPKYLATDQNAQVAVNKLKQLKSNTLTITTSDIILVIDHTLKNIVTKQTDDAIQSIDAKKDEGIKQMTDASLKLLRDFKDSLANIQTLTLNQIEATKASAVSEIKTVSEKEKDELTAIGAKERQHLREQYRKANDLLHQQLRSDAPTTSMGEEQLKNCLRQDLVNFYRTYHSAIPIAPLVEEHEVPLVDFYVQPPLTAVDITSRQLGESQAGLPVQSYWNLFFSSNGTKMHRNIYITAKAGIGKTSFSKRICMAWCQAQNPLQSWVQKFQQEDLEVIKQFEFLFFLPLREADSCSCKVDNMIYDQIINNLAGYHRYTKTFVNDILRDMSCLIVLDGLDEWTHPESCKRRRDVHEIPHRPAWERCSIVTTTRPWKLDVARVSLNQIDVQVEISELNKTSSTRLISNAVSLLNELRLQKKAKSAEDFLQTTSLRNLEAVRYIPYILLQMICLWFEGTAIGKSKCEIYSNILELTFERILTKTGGSYWYSRQKQQSITSSSIPACVMSNESCRYHCDVILSLGKVAFESLFTLNKESSLVFHKAVVLDSFTEDMLISLLKIGLLSQNKDYGHVASRHSNFSFQHKSVQEYYAALYIHCNHDNEHLRQRIRQVCNSLAAVLEMSNVFIFLGGFSSEACGKVLQLLHDIVSNDNVVTHFRNECRLNFGLFSSSLSKSMRSFEAVKCFRDMQADIVQEVINTGQRHHCLYIEDIIIQCAHDKKSYDLLKPLIVNSQSFAKSVCIRDCSSTHQFSEMLDIFGLRDVNELQKLSVFAIPTQPDLQRLLIGSLQTLKSCDIVFNEYNNNRNVPKYTPMTSENIGIILNMGQLLSLTLAAAGLTHSDIEALFNNLSKRKDMTGICLVNLFCTTHKGECGGHRLDLSQHWNLKHLDLHLAEGVSLSNFLVNALSLEYCFIGCLPNHVYSTLSKVMLHATDIREFGVGYSAEAFTFLKSNLPNLPNLNSLFMRHIDLGDSTFTLPTQLMNLDNVRLYKIVMASTVLRTLIDSAKNLPQPVRFILRACTVKPEKEYQHLKGDLRSSQKWRINFDGKNSTNLNVFDFQTVCLD